MRYQKFTITNRVVILFESVASATYNVAGLPAAARAVREAALAGLSECWISAGTPWEPDLRLLHEVERLSGTMRVQFMRGETLGESASTPILLIAGEDLISAETIRSAVLGSAQLSPGLAFAVSAANSFADQLDRGRSVVDLSRAARQIIAATGKTSDGIVSRNLNRPISRAITRTLLNFPAARPFHATIVAGLLGIGMLASLLTGGNTGLVIGALLFQAASIIDGVDGEIARATFRTSYLGAMADSLVDAATNIAFIGGVVVNLWMQGHTTPAMAGAAGLAMMALGLFLIGKTSFNSGNDFTFNGVKDRFANAGSRIMLWLTWLTMRDFIALAAVLITLAGFADSGIFLFAVVAAGWLAVVVQMQIRRAGIDLGARKAAHH